MKKDKILRAHTIIPSGLYVERSADAQLRRVVLEMGRPGYILVSRQMGKTNLLLHAKRTLTNDADKFLYLDVSNTFPEIKDFFQNVIDTTLDSHPDLFLDVAEEILKRRASPSTLPAHKVHEQELRTLLRKIPGRFVICLDEIDALTKTNYSDQVFSFIRSIYFSGRVNFPEFERLTYILSGVAEPGELIKNKDISPFNIGEKIYLDDFSADEFGIFIEKSKLKLSQEIISRIYHWTSGSPRISWDVCAQLEDALNEGYNITPKFVDDLIHRLYLVNHDLPPVDHIRTLVEDDSQIRDAIMSIHYGKSDGISDSIRNRLYLAGITRPIQGKGKHVSIRNKILNESLSEVWIQDVERRQLSLFEIAKKKFSQGKYNEALILYKDYLNSTNDQIEQDLAYYSIGDCYLRLENYEAAIESFSHVSLSNDYSHAIYYMAQHYTGVCHLIIGEYEKSEKYFRIILDENPEPSSLNIYLESCLNLATALMTDVEKNFEEIIKLNNIILNFKQSFADKPDSNQKPGKLFYAAYYNIARANKKIGNIDAARHFFELAVYNADSRVHIALALEQASLASSDEQSFLILENCVTHVIEKNLAVTKKDTDTPLDFTSEICVKLIERLEESKLSESLDKLLCHLADNKINHRSGVFDFITPAIYNLILREKYGAAIRLVERSLNIPVDEVNVLSRRNIMVIGALIMPDQQKIKIHNDYLREYLYASASHIEDIDLRLYWNVVEGHIYNKKYDDAKAIISRVEFLLINKLSSEMSAEKNNSATLIIDVMDFNLSCAITNNEPANIIKAENILSRIKNIATLGIPYFSPDFIGIITKKIRFFLATHAASPTLRRDQRKYGRNEFVKVLFEDGTVVDGKYKKFKLDIDAKNCKVID